MSTHQRLLLWVVSRETRSSSWTIFAETATASHRAPVMTSLISQAPVALVVRIRLANGHSIASSILNNYRFTARV
ncbi:hypothetical protein BV22DRAFT_1030494 [Leucogyrophana mollusca]|uniref:Uncharacterized protein n=1 Tax=Leucogyrophana mollusca TaxID=85980 RepID=A0ACB8BU34_9AGAM|nr:hypothetical protein BV22DRAFT_1030494 [Leucogyrophana mollusca]